MQLGKRKRQINKQTTKMKKNKAGKHENRRIGASQKKRPVSKTFYRNCYFPAISFPRTHHSRSLRIPDFFFLSQLLCFLSLYQYDVTRHDRKLHQFAAKLFCWTPRHYLPFNSTSGSPKKKQSSILFVAWRRWSYKPQAFKAYSAAVVAALTIVEGIDKFPFAIKPKVISNFFLSRKSEEKKRKEIQTADSGARHLPCPPLKSNWRQHQHHLSRGLLLFLFFSLFLFLRRHLQVPFFIAAPIGWPPSLFRITDARILLVSVPPCHLPRAALLPF